MTALQSPSGIPQVSPLPRSQQAHSYVSGERWTGGAYEVERVVEPTSRGLASHTYLPTPSMCSKPSVHHQSSVSCIESLASFIYVQFDEELQRLTGLGSDPPTTASNLLAACTWLLGACVRRQQRGETRRQWRWLMVMGTQGKARQSIHVGYRWLDPPPLARAQRDALR